MSVNNFLPFCETDTGTNLLTDAEYSVDSGRTAGNVPGIARSKLVNKALRQSNAVTSQLAQLVANMTGQDILDDGNTSKLLSQISASLMRLPRKFNVITGAGGYTFSTQYYFFVTSASASVGAVYTNSGSSFTVVSTIASGTLLAMTATGDPAASGLFTKTSGTGDATITFYAFRKPTLKVRLVGGGGGGGPGGTAGTGAPGTDGSVTTFGGTIFVANGGLGGGSGGSGQGAGGAASSSISAAFLINGARGGYGDFSGTSAPGAYVPGGMGGASLFGGGGANFIATGYDGTGYGSGGGGGGLASGLISVYAGGGGGAGAYAEGIIENPNATYSGLIGSGGAGSGGAVTVGGAGASGAVVVLQEY